MGTFSLELIKNEENIWPDLFNDFSSRSKIKHKIWYEIENRYPDDMEIFYDKLSKYLENKKNKKKRKRRRRPGKCYIKDFK